MDGFHYDNREKQLQFFEYLSNTLILDYENVLPNYETKLNVEINLKDLFLSSK